MIKDCINCIHGDKHPLDQPCSLCTAKGDLPPTHWEPDGTDSPVLTNADRIRAMSDEELAEFLAEEAFRIAKPVFDTFGWGVKKQVVCSQKLKWLKQPAEE